MVALYHAPFSVSSQAVRMTLAEKHVEWEDRLIDLLKGEQLTPEFLAINPRGEVPVLVHGDAVLTESTAICEYIDEAFHGGASLVPTNPAARQRMRALLVLFQNTIHQACGVMTYAVLARPLLRDLPPEHLEALFAAIPDKRVVAWRRNVLERGIASSDVALALAEHRRFFAFLESRLPSQHSWLAGDSFSLADITALSYVMRADHIGMGALFGPDRYPHLRSWYMRTASRSSVQTALLRYVDEASQTLLMDLVVQAQPELAPLLDA